MQRITQKIKKALHVIYSRADIWEKLTKFLAAATGVAISSPNSMPALYKQKRIEGESLRDELHHIQKLRREDCHGSQKIECKERRPK